MASSSEQIWLGNRGVTGFEDVTPELIKEVDSLKDRDFQYRIFRWLTTLALFYKTEKRNAGHTGAHA
jgi:hypothetical protein